MANQRRAKSRTTSELRDWHVCVLLVLLSILVRVPLLGHFDRVTYDGTYYINHAKTMLGLMDRPSGFPIGYSVLIALFIPIIRDGVRAAQAVSFLSGLGSLLVFYFLAKRFVRKSYAIAGSCILALMPLFINLSLSTMSESPYILWLLLGLLFYAKGNGVLTGLFMGLATITRPEALGVLGVLAILMLRRPKKLLRIIAGFACVYSVNMAIQSGISGKLTIVPKANLFGSSAENQALRESWVDFSGKEEMLEVMLKKKGETTVLADYLARLPREILLLMRHASPAILLLSVYGIVRRRLFLLASMVPFFAYPLFTFRSEHRFVLPFIPALILYAFIGLEGLRRNAVRRLACGIVIASAALGIYINREQIFSPVPVSEKVAKHEGLLFRPLIKPGDAVADRKPYFSFYAEGRYVEIPIGPYDETLENLAGGGVEYLYLDRDLISTARPHLRPLLYDRAAIAGEMRFAQRHFNPEGACVYQRTADSEPARKRSLLAPAAKEISGLDWSPDGRTIAYRSVDESGRGGIYFISPEGGPPRLAIADAGSEDQISWAPDSKRIAFAMKRADNIDIYVRTESGAIERVTSHPAIDRSPSWSRDGAEIIFCSERSGRSEIWSKNLGTNILRQITTSGENRNPAISPDGEHIAWIRRGEGIFIYAREAGNVTSCDSPRKVSFKPSWSPDGRFIAVSAADWGATDIYLLTADGRSALLLTKSTSARMGDPAWSPDGAAIAVVTLEDDTMGIAILTDIEPYKQRLLNPPPFYVFQPRK